MECNRKIKLLLVEDYPLDADLAIEHLRVSGFDPQWTRVDTPEDYVANLEPDLDLIVADYDLPRFTGRDALHMLKQSGYRIPFVIFSGSVQEEIAAACLRDGADDFVYKENPGGLVSSVQRVMRHH